MIKRKVKVKVKKEGTEKSFDDGARRHSTLFVWFILLSRTVRLSQSTGPFLRGRPCGILIPTLVCVPKSKPHVLVMFVVVNKLTNSVGPTSRHRRRHFDCVLMIISRFRSLFSKDIKRNE